MMYMLKLNTIFLLTVLSLISCGSNSEHISEKESPIIKGENEPLMKEAFSQDSTVSKKFINYDDFVFGVIDNELTLSFLESTATSKVEATVPNLHNESVSDTVFKFKNDSNFFKFHKAPSNTILTEAEITSDQYKVGNGEIFVGVPYKVLQDRFNLNTTVDTLIVKDFENSNYFMFLFDKEQAVSKIIFRTRYLD